MKIAINLENKKQYLTIGILIVALIIAIIFLGRSDSNTDKKVENLLNDNQVTGNIEQVSNSQNVESVSNNQSPQNFNTASSVQSSTSKRKVLRVVSNTNSQSSTIQQQSSDNNVDQSTQTTADETSDSSTNSEDSDNPNVPSTTQSSNTGDNGGGGEDGQVVTPPANNLTPPPLPPKKQHKEEIDVHVVIAQGVRIDFVTNFDPSSLEDDYSIDIWSYAISDRTTCDASTFDKLYTTYRAGTDPHIKLMSGGGKNTVNIKDPNSPYFGYNICFKAELAKNLEELQNGQTKLVFSKAVAIPAKSEVFPAEVRIIIDRQQTRVIDNEVENVVIVSARHHNISGIPTSKVVSYVDYNGNNRYYGNYDLADNNDYITKEILNTNCPVDHSTDSHSIIFKSTDLNDTACIVGFTFERADYTDPNTGVTYTYPTIVETMRVI